MNIHIILICFSAQFRGIWIIHSSWALESMDYDYMIDEAPHEAKERFPGIEAFRNRKKENGTGKEKNVLLDRMKVFYDGKLNPSEKEFKFLVKNCGGSICNNADVADIIISSKIDKSHGRKNVIWKTYATSWLFDSIENGKFELKHTPKSIRGNLDATGEDLLDKSKRSKFSVSFRNKRTTPPIALTKDGMKSGIHKQGKQSKKSQNNENTARSNEAFVTTPLKAKKISIKKNKCVLK